MKIKKILYKIIRIIFKGIMFLSIFILTLLALFVAVSYINTDVSDGITKDKLLKLEIGMTENETLKILGKPIKKVDYERDYQGRETSIYIYATSILEINISISNKILDRVELEFYDTPFYLCRVDSCPKIISPFLWKYLIPNN